MNDSSFPPKAISMTGFVYIRSKLDLETLGEAISNQLFKGINFSGLNNYIYDEVPAIYTVDVLGCRFIIQQLTVNERCDDKMLINDYGLEIEDRLGLFGTFNQGQSVNLSRNLSILIDQIEELEVAIIPFD